MAGTTDFAGMGGLSSSECDAPDWALAGI